MQRLIVALVMTFMFSMAGLIAAPLLVDLEGYKEALLKTIKSSTGLEPKINGRIKVSFFPTPVVRVGNVTIDNIKDTSSPHILYIEAVEVEGTFLSMLSGQVDVEEVKLIRPVLELEELNDGRQNWRIFEDAIKKRDASASAMFLEEISIVNGTISHNRNLVKTSIDYLSGRIVASSANGPFAIDGNFSSEADTIAFTGNIGELNNGAEADLTIKSESINLVFKGSYSKEEQAKLEGSVEGGSQNLSKFVQMIFGGNKMANVTSDEAVNIKGDFFLSGSYAKFSNMQLDSDSLGGKANIDVFFNSGEQTKGLQWDVALDIDKIDIDKLFAKQELVGIEETEIDYYAYSNDDIRLSDFRFDIPMSFSMILDISIDEVNYNDKKIQKLRVDTDIFDGKANIRQISAALPGQSKFSVVGNVDNNGTRPIFTGKIGLSGKDLREVVTWLYRDASFIPEGELSEYMFTTNMNITPQKLDFFKTELSFDKSLFTGNAYIRPTGIVPVIDVELNVDIFDLDRYGITEKINELIQSVYEWDNDKRLEQTWLNKFKVQFNLDVNSRGLVYNGHKIKNQTISLEASKGLFDLKSFIIDSDVMKITSRLVANINNIEDPKLYLLVDSSRFDTALFIEKDDVEVTDIEDSKVLDWSSEPFNFLGIGRFNGSARVEIDHFTHGNIEIDNIVVKGDLQNRIFEIEDESDGKAEIFGGQVDVRGQIGLNEKNPSMGLIVSLSQIDMIPAFTAFSGKGSAEGKFNFNGTLSTRGDSPVKWVKNLKTAGQAWMQPVTFPNIDLETIILRSRDVNSVIDMNEIVEKALVNGQTKFTRVKGNVSSMNGILQARDVVLRSRYIDGAFSGNLNMFNLDMNGVSKLAYKPERNKKVVLGVKLSGNLFDMKKELNTDSLESYINSKGIGN